MGLRIISIAIMFVSVVVADIAEQSVCNRKCGNITVPYPFGFGNSSQCFKDEYFQLNCSESRLFTGTVPMVNMSLEEGTATVDLYVAFNCKNIEFSSHPSLGSRRPFRFSNTRNMLTVIGCNTIAEIKDPGGGYASGCLSLCEEGTEAKSRENLIQDINSCSGVGCCQTPIPQGLKQLNTYLSLYNVNQSRYNPCSYGFLAGSNFTLKETDDPDFLRSAVVLDWAIGNMTCEEASKTGNKSEYICGPNSHCINSKNGPGYRCACNYGYEGNPYVTETGCLDIDECAPTQEKNRYPCKGICKNSDGSYICNCRFGYHGNAKVGCSMKQVIKVLIGVGALFVLVTSILISLWLYKKRMLKSNHLKNGGLLLHQLTVKSFKEAQLEKATDNFDDKMLLGEGGNGWVYRGLLEETIHIAVKKSKIIDQDQIEQFLNEADIVSKINHKNVVKLLGVCLDSKVPMLVYEFVANGTIFQHLHGNSSRILDSWRICLRVAAETARALDYMHSLAYPPIIHRDIKSSNILLDGTYTAKVADFGASKLIRLDRTMAPTQGQGTMGYLDPEYLQTGELTTMSDVYGFGVVLMELLSKQRPLSRGLSGEMISLVKIFTLAIENGRFDEVLRVAEASDKEIEQVCEVAKPAMRCVAMPSTKRPTMTEVAEVLNGMSKEYSSFPVEGGGVEMDSLLDNQDVMTTSVHFELEYSGSG
ncbi:hypothetical protein ACHQM5_001422 [Ranunculus cassubicifolius]